MRREDLDGAAERTGKRRTGVDRSRSGSYVPGKRTGSTSKEFFVNIGEIAKRAGVSRSTVSYALSGKRP
ncbi:LacI family DNA-binding transcriptional regulator, partial [Streptomyces sp. NPDC096046]|uniref:LacI family DNA-binding transcriptional regulator n=1 Tax=Streptomyces sp. NPDC096046 TaxID=3155542 RepID=UPI00331AD358